MDGLNGQGEGGHSRDFFLLARSRSVGEDGRSRI